MKLDIAFLALTEASAMSEVLVLAAGKVEFSHADPIQVDEASAQKVIAAFNAQGVQLPIDYEHSTYVKGEKAEKAPAAGWITAMRWEPGRGLVASVEWTREARGYIKEGEYKYLSPIIYFDAETRSPCTLHSMALTNKPATRHQKELLAASAAFLETTDMPKDVTGASDKKDVKKKGVLIAQDEEAAAGPAPDELAMAVGELAGALKAAGVPIDEGASVVAIVKAATAKIGGDGAGEGGGEGEATPEEVAASENVLKVLGAKDGNEAILKLKADFVPRADHKLLSDRLNDLEKRDGARAVDTIIATMVDENKINPNDEEQLKACRDYAEKDLAGFTAFMAAQHPYMEPGRTVSAGLPVKKDARKNVIVAGDNEWLNSPLAQRTNRIGWLNQTLRDADMAVLSGTEIKELN